MIATADVSSAPQARRARAPMFGRGVRNSAPRGFMWSDGVKLVIAARNGDATRLLGEISVGDPLPANGVFHTLTADAGARIRHTE